MKIPWTEKRTNESILNELGKKLTLKSKIRKQQANFFGHAMRRQGLENLITTARVLGKRSRGRPREKILDGVRKWAGEERTVDLITKTQDRSCGGTWSPTPFGKELDDDDESLLASLSCFKKKWRQFSG